MKRNQIAAAILVTVTAMATNTSYAANDSSVYGGIGYSFITYKESGISGFDMGTLGVTLGKRVMDNLAIEGLVGFGVSDSTQTVSGTSVTLGTGTYVGVYARPFVQLNENLEVYGRLGWFRGELDLSVRTTSISDTGSDFSYGLGAAILLTKSTAITLDYTNYYDKQSTTVDGFTIGYRLNF